MTSLYTVTLIDSEEFACADIVTTFSKLFRTIEAAKAFVLKDLQDVMNDAGNEPLDLDFSDMTIAVEDDFRMTMSYDNLIYIVQLADVD